MKNFFTSMLGALVALIIFAVGTTLVFVVVLAVIAAAGSKQKTLAVESGSYLVFDLSAQITDAPPGSSLSEALSSFGEDEGQPVEYQLRQVTAAIRRAAGDKRIAGIFMHGEMPPSVGYSNGFAQLQEIRGALAEFRLAHKPVLAYLGFAGTKEVFLASVADELVIDPYGFMAIPGLAMQPVFLAGAFEKFGIGVQVTRVGKYKAAIEPFTRTDMSPENRAQAQKLIDDLWSEFVSGFSVARGITSSQLQAVVDKEGLLRAKTALEAGLVTRVAYRDEVLEDLKARTGRKGFNEPFKQVSLADYIGQGGHRIGKGGDGGEIALVYAEGPIVDGFGGPGEIGGLKFARELRDLREDEQVKAIVLRVNSPGGSATASEHIQREIRLARKAKPVIVSMGTYAASGGYWISTYADRIFAEPSTITGSIGVFGLMPNYQKLANNLGITFDRVKTGRFADAASAARPKTDEELARVQSIVDWIYEEFVGKVVESRGLERAHVEEIAQGRVWSGTEALKLGLVDEIGGLDAAVRFAAEKAGLGEKYRLEEYPAKKDLMEVLSEKFSGEKRPVTGGAVSELFAELKNQAKVLEEFNDPSGVYARLPLELQMK